MVDEMIETVRAAFAPEADAAMKQRAAAVLRGLLGVLEGGPAGGAAPPSAAPPQSAPGADLLSTIIEYVRPHVPADALAQVPRLRLPLIDFGASIKRLQIIGQLGPFARPERILPSDCCSASLP